MCFVRDGNVKVVSRYLGEMRTWQDILEERCTGGKTKIICSGGKFRHILNLPEKVFYDGDTKFSYTAGQWIEAQDIETGKCIHHKMCGHGGEPMVKVWVLNDKGKKTPVPFGLMDMNLKLALRCKKVQFILIFWLIHVFFL